MAPRSRRIHQQWSILHAYYRLADACCIFFSVWIAAAYNEYVPASQMLVIGAATIVTHRIVSEITGMYRSWRGAAMAQEAGCAILTWLCTIPLLLVVGYFTRYSAQYTRTSVLIWIAVTPATIFAARIFARRVQYWLRKRGYNTQRYAVCGINEIGLELVRNIEQSPSMGLDFAGFYDDRPDQRIGDVPAELGQKIGDVAELVQHAKRGTVQTVYITFPMRAEDRIRGVLEQLGDTTASVYVVPDFFVFELLHARWNNIGGVPIVSVFENPLYGVDGLLKRVADLVLGTLLLAVFAIPMSLIAMLVKVTSPGPIFFRQRRYGLDGEEILVWKFRSMVCCDNGPIIKQATRDDDRITPLGGLLRRTSLDELPQLFNVIEGSMSLVGPRPHATAHNEEYRSQIRGYMMRHKVKPGITGLAQVRGFRGETETLEKMQRRIHCDHQYIREWSLGMDIKILLETVWVVLLQKSAY